MATEIIWRYKLTAIASVLFLSAGAATCAPHKVYVFLSETCPISRYYTLALKDLHAKYASDKLEFIAVFPNPLSTSRTIAAFEKKYSLPFPCIRDFDHTWVNRLRATITPEVVVVNPADSAVYRGRIDNAFARIGKRRRTITEHDLAAVLNILGDGKSPSFRQTQAIGCFITPLQKAKQE